MPLPSNKSPGLMCAPAKMVTVAIPQVEQILVVDVRRRIRRRADHGIGQALISELVVVLVEGNDEKAVMGLAH